ncbi:hypothetical protein A5819_000060 [Enterococcus sp. 7E2_DIV0204]|uniref:hypothetical protein n=1 Tax=unclassified Enterococcus TaxID=2608891 RepID=UPI000A35220D|nr:MULTISPECIES: hypothetical protein [unclassified Enterococcus]OTN87614.1 hypothetical protein A5819_000060 [Enterococcus sp. 7E2_DIV0204]OTP49706.1 hypothetical protein A5884_002906 [Enterococcus sp. 7D2_DIV0200]
MNIDLVSVCVGVVSSAVIPFVTWTFRKYNNHSKYKSFKNLLLQEYVNQYTNMKHSDNDNQHIIMKEIENSIKDLSILNKSIMNSNIECKFQMLRAIDYTVELLYTLNKEQHVLAKEVYPALYHGDSTKMEEELNKYDKKFNDYGKRYIDSIDDFVEMKINTF